jgi:hypothetical protein
MYGCGCLQSGSWDQTNSVVEVEVPVSIVLVVLDRFRRSGGIS